MPTLEVHCLLNSQFTVTLATDFYVFYVSTYRFPPFMFPVPSSGHALAGIARNLRWCKRQRLNSIQPLSILDTNIPSRLRSTGNSAERISETPRAQQGIPSIMNASDFRYMFPNVFPPAGTQMPSLMSSQNPPSSFNPFAPTFVPVPHGQGQRRSPSPQVALTLS